MRAATVEAPNAPHSARSQRDRILQRLIEARGDWVPLPEIAAYAAQYNARIFELRRLGFAIENRTREIDGVRHSWFRLDSVPPSVARASHTDLKDKGIADELPLFQGGQ